MSLQSTNTLKAALDLIGEQEDKIMFLEQDIQDAKTVFRKQITELLDKIASLEKSKS